MKRRHSSFEIESDLAGGPEGAESPPDNDNEFFTDEQSLAELVTHMPEDDQRRFNNYGHFRVEPAFINRVFIVYRPTGLTPAGKHNPPEIANLLKVVDFGVDPRTGCYTVLKDQNTQQELTITHVPRRVYEYPLYMSVPTKLMLRWDARHVSNPAGGRRVSRSMSFAVLIKARNKADFYSKGNTYCETLNHFRRLYPSVPGDFSFS